MGIVRPTAAALAAVLFLAAPGPSCYAELARVAVPAAAPTAPAAAVPALSQPGAPAPALLPALPAELGAPAPAPLAEAAAEAPEAAQAVPQEIQAPSAPEETPPATQAPAPEQSPVLGELSSRAAARAPEGGEPSRQWAARLFDGEGPADSPSVVKHDAHRFELNMDVRLAPGLTNVYRVSAYLFVPHALGITPPTFSRESFYRHIQRRIRYKTPRMSLGEILDPGNDASPLKRLAATLDRPPLGAEDDSLPSAAYTQIRLLGAVASAALREQAARLVLAPRGAEAEIHRLAAAARVLVGRVRSLRADLAASGAPEKLRRTMNYLDEYLSLSISEHFVPLLAALRGEAPERPAAAAAQRELTELIKSEDARRAASGYRSVVDKPTASEALYYRRTVLKNFFASVLDLETKTDYWSGAFQILFGFSAAVAMLVYLAAMQFVQGRVSAGGIAFLVIGVLAYVVKDRIKEALRAWSTRSWRRFFSDVVTGIRDPATGKAIGKVRESFSFVQRSDVPEEVLRRRNADPLSVIGEDGKREEILRYEKEVRLRPGAVKKFQSRRLDLEDSLLVNLLPFLENTEDPQVGFAYLDPATDRLEALPGSRVYHINMVTHHEVLRPKDHRASSYDRLRIVLDREGIKRMERVPSRQD